MNPAVIVSYRTNRSELLPLYSVNNLFLFNVFGLFFALEIQLYKGYACKMVY